MSSRGAGEARPEERDGGALEDGHPGCDDADEERNGGREVDYVFVEAVDGDAVQGEADGEFNGRHTDYVSDGVEVPELLEG